MDDLPENNNGGNKLETSDYLHGVKSSTCLLLPVTPSPTTLDFKHPLAQELDEQPFLALNEDNINIADAQNDGTAGDSSSADSNSVVQDPVSAQLINNISMLDYQTLSKNGDLIIGQTEDCKLNGNLKIKNRKLPSFVNWNWVVIRKILLWVVLSGLIACLAAIIGMVITIPKECNPDLPWYQGKVFYEVFPASFNDSNNDGLGDFKGIIKNLDYIQDLGVAAIRLNYIFQTDHYPNNYYNVSSMLKIDRSLGVLKDMQDLISKIHDRNMSIILDLPVISMAIPTLTYNSTQSITVANNTEVHELDATTNAITHWAQAQGVDGFYLKNLENFVDDPYFCKTLQIWKQIIGFDKIFIASEVTFNKAKGDALNVLLSRIDLVDIHINLQEGTSTISDRIKGVIDGQLWSKPHYPWVHWNIGNLNSERISTKHINNTLALTGLELVLPGTVSIFYGDEIGLGGVPDDVESDFHEHKDIHNLVQMAFLDNEGNSNNVEILPWNLKSVLKPNYNFLKVIKNMIKMRIETPTIYLRAIFKEGVMQPNMEIRRTEEDLIVIERWYPRRNTCVFVGNLASKSTTADLSTMFYGGNVIAATNTSLIGQVLYFDHITFSPNSAIVVKLEK